MNNEQQCQKCAGVKGYDFDDGRRMIIGSHHNFFGVSLRLCDECGGTGVIEAKENGNG